MQRRNDTNGCASRVGSNTVSYTVSYSLSYTSNVGSYKHSGHRSFISCIVQRDALVFAITCKKLKFSGSVASSVSMLDFYPGIMEPSE